MSAPADSSKPAATSSGPESPTTARPLEMDDDDVQESGVLVDESHSAPTTTTAAAATTSTPAAAPVPAAAPAAEEAPPPKPPRPTTETQKNEQILQEAFPTIEASVIRAVLRASRGKIDDAFNALLEMTDPDAHHEEPPTEEEEERPPPPPPRPAQNQPLTQMEADELYARQLAEYENAGAFEAGAGAERGPARGGPPPPQQGGGFGGWGGLGDGQYRQQQGGGGPGLPRGRVQTGLNPTPNAPDDPNYYAGQGGDYRERSFMDDDLPVIRENLRKGFVETQTKFNSWINTVKKRFDEAWDEEDGQGGPSQGQGQGQGQGPRPAAGAYGGGRGGFGAAGRRSGEMGRRSGDYDADPEVLSDDFAGMKFHADGTPAGGQRPLANPDLFKPPPPSTSPKPPDGRKVAFKDGAEDIDDAYNASPKVPPKDAAAAKPSKWQPLSAVDPSPIGDADPFSLGDSDDEPAAAGSKDKTPKPAAAAPAEIKLDDNERLKQAAAEAMAESLVDPPAKGAPAGK